MIETPYRYSKVDTKTIEKIVADDHVAINHIVLAQGDSLPEHYSNSNVYMVVVGGTVSLSLGNQKEHAYPSGSIINIPYNIKMNVSNRHQEVLEFFVVKVPSHL